MAEYEKKIRQKLAEYGCYLKRHGKGDHDIWFSPITNLSITVDGEIKSRHVVNAIMNRAGIDHRF
jgi:ubiquinone biosynthesis protein Coq4